MPPTRPPKPVEVEEEVDTEVTELQANLKAYAARKKKGVPRLEAMQAELVKLTGLDPAKDAARRAKEYEDCREAARKRIVQLRAAHDKARKKAPALMDQIRLIADRKAV